MSPGGDCYSDSPPSRQGQGSARASQCFSIANCQCSADICTPIRGIGNTGCVPQACTLDGRCVCALQSFLEGARERGDGCKTIFGFLREGVQQDGIDIPGELRIECAGSWWLRLEMLV